MAKVFTMLELSREVVGEITPTGFHEEDLNRIENLEEHVSIIDGLIHDLVCNVKYAERSEVSIKHIGEKTTKELERIRDFLDEVLEEN